jgi:hypothetical protein
MKAIDLAAASKSLSQYDSELGDETILLMSNQTPVAALVSLKNMDRESLAQDWLALNTNPEFLALIESARQEFRAGKKLSYDAMKEAVEEMP